MKEPVTNKGKLSMLLRIASMNADGDDEDENFFINSIIAFIQNELGDEDGEKFLSRYKLEWNG